jgi:hypothetical protein
MALLDCDYESPLNEVTGSVVLGGEEFVDVIKDRYLRGEKKSRDLPALRQLFTGVTIEAIIDIVATSFSEDPATYRNACIYLCRQHTGEKLGSIGNRFGISDSAVSQVCKRFMARMSSDRRLEKQIAAIERRIKLSKVET